MSTHAMSWALRQDLEDHLLARLLAVLGDFANTSAVAWPSVATLAERVHASARTVQRRLAQLARLGLISVAKQHDRHGRQRSNLYRLNLLPGQGDRGDSVPPKPAPEPEPELALNERGEGDTDDGVRVTPQSPGRVTERCHSSQEDRTDTSRPRESPARDARARARVLLSEQWAPAPADSAFAASLGLAPSEIAEEAASFRDWARARGETFVDVAAAWRRWIVSPCSILKRPAKKRNCVEALDAIITRYRAAESRADHVPE